MPFRSNKQTKTNSTKEHDSTIKAKRDRMKDSFKIPIFKMSLVFGMAANLNLILLVLRIIINTWFERARERTCVNFFEYNRLRSFFFSLSLFSLGIVVDELVNDIPAT